MITPMIFNEAIRELELMFGLIEQDSSRRDDKISVYYDRLKHTGEQTIKKAVKNLIDSHPWKRFPLVQEIKAALSAAAQNTSILEEPEGESLVTCEACHGTGHVLKDMVEESGYRHPVATPCRCQKGRKVEARWIAFKEQKKQGG